eukprot:TRINITY_DN10377_c0_g1_i4.p1 TRINITY_DN10377_c0_g1~~TRINITY_DN10377_c0_g1_i4.p1  ORF type:complete len:453 (-),score=132.79 TRINITY_DN10377_c0_g1_i4:79-1386(-)
MAEVFNIQLRKLSAAEFAGQRSHADPLSPEIKQRVESIIEDVKSRGEAGLLENATRLGDIKEGEPYVLDRSVLKAAYDSLPIEQQQLLHRVAARIKAFAEAQRRSIVEMTMAVPGGSAGHTVAAVERAGCYAPGGRFPLPSSVLMTACTAIAAGVQTVWVASPRPAEITKAAAFVAGADALLAVGGAQAIAAFAYGAGQVPAMDVIVGPGNKYVTAAKQMVSGLVGIDMLAGPSELCVCADSSANPATVAADLIAQAEHDVDAVPIVVTTDASLIPRVEAELNRQLSTLPTASTASVSLARNGYVVLAEDMETAIQICNKIAPEHLELLIENATALSGRFQHYGGLFVGHRSAEVFGDYGVGPNHTLPTSGTARYSGGLSVFNFLRIRTWLNLDSLPAAQEIVHDSMALARLEGLEGHARSAEQRLVGPEESKAE